MYADDVKLHKIVRCEDDARALQSDIDSLARWSREWKLRLNQTVVSNNLLKQTFRYYLQAISSTEPNRHN